MARNGIRAGDTPKPKPAPVPRGTNAQGYDPIKYGEKGLKTGYAKVGQARNQPGVVPPTDPGGPVPATAATSYLNDKQQARVDALLGDAYDPTKPLNVQLFQARWANASQEERRSIAKNLSGDFLEGGPTSKTLSGFHSEYMGVLHELNSVHQKDLEQHLADYANMGGFAQSQAESDANLKFWTDFAATPEGQAHIAQSDYPDVASWIQHQTESMQSGADNYNAQVKAYDQIARVQQQLGIVPTGMKPPGWDSTLQAIQAGHAPLPSAAEMANYPGIAADVAGIDPGLYHSTPHEHPGAGGSAAPTSTSPVPGSDAATMIYQPLFSSSELEAQYV